MFFNKKWFAELATRMKNLSNLLYFLYIKMLLKNKKWFAELATRIKNLSNLLYFLYIKDASRVKRINDSTSMI